MKEAYELSPHELQRYSQQINLQEVGVLGQIRLKNAKVACIGAGGLGSPLLLYLASSGIGTIGIIDDDTVELSNLHRQVLYGEEDIGRSKAECAANKLKKYNAKIKVNIHQTRLMANNAEEILSQYDIVADCSDNFVTRYLLNDICFQLDKPYVSASIMQFQGQCSTFNGKQGPCLRCLFPEIPPADEFLTCGQAGVLNVLPGLFGVIQATEIIKWVLQKGDLLAGRVLTADILKMQFREYGLTKNPDCGLCGNHRMIQPVQESEPCLRSNLTVRDYIITSFEVKKLLKDNADIQLLDVRALDKHMAFNIGGKHIPMVELSDRFNELDPDKMVVTYCTSGGNSMRALQLLLSAGFKSVKSLDGGMTAWQAENDCL